ncbi:MAG: beta-ketoacyl-ACP synthase III [Myxococcota bacterium]
MARAVVRGSGHYVPDRVVTNDELAERMPTSDEWIQQRTGIKERRHVDFDNDPQGSSAMGAKAAQAALSDAGLSPTDIDCVIYGTLSPDKVFPGDAVLIQAAIDIPSGVPCFDLRNQCSGFLYGLQTADAFIRGGIYRRVLLIGAETHSTGLDFTERGRDVAVIFGDGAAAVVLERSDDESRGVLAHTLGADGRFADELHCSYPSSAMNPRVTVEKIKEDIHYPVMNGKNVFKHAVTRMPEAVNTVLSETGLKVSDLDLLIPHQANLRISEMVQKRLELRDDQVFNNIMHYGNTTAASIPLALDEARKSGRIGDGSLVCLAAFGAGFTWGAALIRF